MTTQQKTPFGANATNGHGPSSDVSKLLAMTN